MYSVMLPCLCGEPSTVRSGFGIFSFRTVSPSRLASVGVRKLSVAPLSINAFSTLRIPERNNGICIALGNVIQVVRIHSPLAQVISLEAVKNPHRIRDHDHPQLVVSFLWYWRFWLGIVPFVPASWHECGPPSGLHHKMVARRGQGR